MAAPRTGVVRVLLVSVWVAVRVTTVSEVPGKVMVVPSVPARVRVLLTVRVFALVTVRVPVLVVIVSPLKEVAVMAPEKAVAPVTARVPVILEFPFTVRPVVEIPLKEDPPPL